MIKWVVVIAFVLGGQDFWIESHYAPVGQYQYFETEDDCIEELLKRNDIIIEDFKKSFPMIESFHAPMCVKKDIHMKTFPDKPELKPVGQPEDEMADNEYYFSIHDYR